MSLLQRRKGFRSITTNAELGRTHLLNNRQSSPIENSLNKSFKLMNGRDGTTTFLPLDSKIGGQVRPNVAQFVTREQANYVYKQVETGKMINTDTIQQEIEQEQLNRMDDMNGGTNPY